MPSTVYSNAAGAGYEAWPDLVYLQNGDLISTLGDGTTHTGNGTKVLLRRSTDNGVTWGSTVTVADRSGSSLRCLPNLGMQQLAGGTLLKPYSTETNVTLAAGTAYVASSTDNGATWNQAYSTVAVPSGYDWLFLYGQLIELTPGGTILMPAYAQVTATGFWDALILKSTDGGVNWTLDCVVAPGTSSHLYSEMSVVNTGGNNWVAMVRDDQTATPSITQFNSTNNRGTWVSAGIFDSSAAVSPCLYQLDATHLFFAYGRRQATGANTGIVLWTSADGGSTWTGGTPTYSYLYDSTFNGTDLGYPAMAKVANAFVGAVWYNTLHDVVFRPFYSVAPLVAAPVQTWGTKSVSPGTTLQSNAASSPVTTGNTLLIFIAHEGVGSDFVVSSIQDTAGNDANYVQDATRTTTSSHDACDIWRCTNATGGSSFKVTVNTSGSSYITLTCMEVAGLQASPLDGSPATATGASSSQINSGTQTTTNPNDFVVLAYASGGQSVMGCAPAGFTTAASHASSGADEDGAVAYQGCSFDITTEVQYWSGQTNAGNWVGLSIGYKAAPASSGGGLWLIKA